MDRINQEITSALDKCGYQYKTVDSGHVPELLGILLSLEKENVIDRRIFNSYLKGITDTGNQPGDARTIYVIAMPAYTTGVAFAFPDRTLKTVIPPTYIGEPDDARAKAALTGVLEPAGYMVTRARLPLKTLAVRSGLAVYGKNNITYVPRRGSFHRLVAFYSDLPCGEDNWQAGKLMPACDNCHNCLDNCPTKAINTDRFVIHAERCLTFLNESAPEFPAWAPPPLHNALIGCMRCQNVCPVDRPMMGKVQHGPVFTERETASILNKTPFKDLSPATQQKLKDIAYDDEWLYPVLARNLRVLINR